VCHQELVKTAEALGSPLFHALAAVSKQVLLADVTLPAVRSRAVGEEFLFMALCEGKGV
jgi:hypothetical protein